MKTLFIIVATLFVSTAVAEERVPTGVSDLCPKHLKCDGGGR